jgi:diguanylate cyclase (GGDEF)-like protein
MKREGRSACVLMLDLDYFKAVNDEHGHAMGDRVLMYASTCVQAQLREVDVLSRWGGEEFIILLPRTDLDGGLQVAERIRAWMAQPLDATWPPRLRVSATLGVARWRPDQDVMMAIGLADQALYAGKAAGRNRVQTVDAPAAP